MAVAVVVLGEVAAQVKVVAKVVELAALVVPEEPAGLVALVVELYLLNRRQLQITEQFVPMEQTVLMVQMGQQAATGKPTLLLGRMAVEEAQAAQAAQEEAVAQADQFIYERAQ